MRPEGRPDSRHIVEGQWEPVERAVGSRVTVARCLLAVRLQAAALTSLCLSFLKNPYRAELPRYKSTYLKYQAYS